MDKQIDTVLFRNEIEKNGIEAAKKKFGDGNKKQTVQEFLNDMLLKYDKAVGDIQKRADMSSYIYDIFNGKTEQKKQKIDRDKLIRVAIGFPLSIDETNTLLKCGDCTGLHANNRDLCIMEVLTNMKCDVTRANLYLEEQGQEILK